MNFLKRGWPIWLSISMLCWAVLSRTTSILNDEKIDSKKKEYCFELAQSALANSRKIFLDNLKEMGKNRDRQIKSLSEKVCSHEEYGLDIIDF